MSIPNEALQKVGTMSALSIFLLLNIRKLAQEIESQAISAQREINIVKTNISAKQRDIRIFELTSTEIKSLSKDTKVYEGVGKM